MRLPPGMHCDAEHDNLTFARNEFLLEKHSVLNWNREHVKDSGVDNEAIVATHQNNPTI